MTKIKSTLVCASCGKTCKPEEMIRHKGYDLGVRNKCKPCQLVMQRATNARRAEREAEAARLDRERIAALRQDPTRATPRTVIGEGIYKPQPWVVRDGALAYRSVPSRGIGV